MYEAAGDGSKGAVVSLTGRLRGGFPAGRRYQHHARALLIAGPYAQRAAECAHARADLADISALDRWTNWVGSSRRVGREGVDSGSALLPRVFCGVGVGSGLGPA